MNEDLELIFMATGILTWVVIVFGLFLLGIFKFIEIVVGV